MSAGRRRRGLALLAALASLSGCGPDDTGGRQVVVEGDPASGARIIRRLGCGACHRIPGVPGAWGGVGPSLAGFARQGYVAGELPNRVPELIRWLRNAPGINPRTAMPAFDLTDREARNIAAYLYRLE